ncbi:aminotransferase class I/II-fold pyridoxal phosphate-dependent enzyme [Sinorhizobium americanum]|uniref:Glycine C-acetyltransferase n=1 Tax=Sinorhizobium americanum TaxID=194963 RepID=A0A4V2REV5_9HYPH|nr:aminotransferase class I/II-fold pyridoxal phosphate-dependent enzyme [Sinorhizobium americanum]TCN30190.1 glycine C-acetyltransferase [Sinorhizobium americanum]
MLRASRRTTRQINLKSNPRDEGVLEAYMGRYEINRKEAIIMASRETPKERLATVFEWNVRANPTMHSSISIGALPPTDLGIGAAKDHFVANETHLIKRWTPVGNWFHDRGKLGLDPYQKSAGGKILPYVSGYSRDGTPFSGVNFASQDYLSLSSHPRLLKAANDAATRFGVHSAGSAALMGNSDLSLALEKKLEEFLGFKECTLFPTGWTAGYGIVKMLAQPGDHVVMDILAHACLQEGAENSGARIHRFPHLSNEGVERRLKRIRTSEPSSGILVVTETLFSMDSDSPDIKELQAICSAYNAVLLVDCAHDLGCIGPTGRGILELQDMVGKVDVLLGTFSKTFASIGGFVATQFDGFRTAVRACCGPQTFTNAMTPIQAAVILEAFRLIESDEGQHRRLKLRDNIDYLRTQLKRHGFVTLGEPSAIVPVVVGDCSEARTMTSLMIKNGAVVNLVEPPAVAKNQSRWRLQVMADHSNADIDTFISCAVKARASITPYDDAVLVKTA